jgi:predicted transcriptional regulator
VALNLRLDDAQLEALRTRAQIEDRSMQLVIVAAIEEYLQRHGTADLVNRSLDRVLPRYAEVLRRLAE